MSKQPKNDQGFKFRLVSRWLTIDVDSVGRSIALAAIAALTVLGAMYIYLSAVNAGY